MSYADYSKEFLVNAKEFDDFVLPELFLKRVTPTRIWETSPGQIENMTACLLDIRSGRRTNSRFTTGNAFASANSCLKCYILPNVRSSGMPTNNPVRGRGHPRPRFFEDSSVRIEPRAFLRSLRRNELLYSLRMDVNRPPNIVFSLLLRDRLAYMTVASMIGVFLSGLPGGAGSTVRSFSASYSVCSWWDLYFGPGQSPDSVTSMLYRK